MQLLTVPMPGLKSLTVLAMVGVGSRYENDKTAGISHFLEHLPFKGTKNYPTAIDLASAVDGVGGKHNAFTSKEYTGYWVKVASKDWKLALDVVSDLLMTPILNEEDIEREKGVIVEEINMYEDQPQAKVSDLFDELVFEGTHLARPVIGYKETVKSFDKKDFMEHQALWYNPENVVIGLVGDLAGMGNGEVEATVLDYFSKGIPRRGGGTRVFGFETQSAPQIKVFYKQTEQAHFYYGFPAISRKDPDRYALSVLVTLLGGNSSSRLFNEIREKRGLAYYAYASADLYHDAGSVYALEGVTVGKIEEAIKVTREEFEKLLKPGGITKYEVKQAKEYVTGKMTLDLEDSASMANMVVRRLLLDEKVETIDDVLNNIRQVEFDRVAAVAKRVMDFSKGNLAIVGPYKDEEPFRKLL